MLDINTLADTLRNHGDYLQQAQMISPNLYAHQVEKIREVQALVSVLRAGGWERLADHVDCVRVGLRSVGSFDEAAELFHEAARDVLAAAADTPQGNSATAQPEPVMPAHPITTDPADGSHTTAPLPPGSSALSFAINDGGHHLRREQSVSEVLMPNAFFDGAKVTLVSPKNGWVTFCSFAESNQGVEVEYSAAFDTLSNGVHQIRSTGTDLHDKSNRPIQNHAVYTYLEQLCISRFGTQELYNESHIPPSLRTANPSRHWDTRPGANKLYPGWSDDVLTGVAVKAPPTGNQMMLHTIYVGEIQAGLYTGTLTFTDPGGTTDYPVELLVEDVTLPHKNSQWMGAFASRAALADRLRADLFASPGDPNETGISQELIDTRNNFAKSEEQLEEQARVLREHGFDTFFEDCRQLDGLPTPIPDSNRLKILSGQAYSAANGFIGRGADTPHNVDVVGVYSDVKLWPGYNNTATKEANRVSIRGLIDARQAALAAAGIVLDEDIGYTNDEGSFEAAEKVAYAYDPDATGISPMGTYSWVTGHRIDKAIPASPSMRRFAGASHCASKDFNQIIADLHTAGKKINIYNRQSPGGASSMMEEEPYAILTNAITDFVDKLDGWWLWSSHYGRHNEIEDVSGKRAGDFLPTSGPAPGVEDEKHNNPQNSAHTFGNVIPETGDDPSLYGLGGGQRRTSMLDGYLVAPRYDEYYSDHPKNLGADGFVVRPVMKTGYRRQGQLRELLILAYAKDSVATDALIAGLNYVTMFQAGAGQGGNATLAEGQDPTYASHGRSMDNLTPDDMTAFERGLINISKP